MQGVFGPISLVDVNVRAPGYASLYAILPRFSSPCSWLLMHSCFMSRQTTNHVNLAPWEGLF